MPSSELRERMKKVRLANPVEEQTLRAQYLELTPGTRLMAGVILGVVMSAAVGLSVLKFVGEAAAPIVLMGLAGSIVAGLFAMRKNVNRLSRPPGSFLLSVSGFFCSRKTQEEVADQVIADMRIEYNQALFEKRKIKARWIRIRYCWIFFCAVGLYRVLNVIADIILKRSSH